MGIRHLLAALALLPLGAGLPPGGGGTALAQYSPNCLYNGRPDPCAITPGPEDPAAGRSVVTVVYADHRAFRLERSTGDCRHEGPRTTCAVTLRADNGNGAPVVGRYEGTWYEGGHRHEVRAGGHRITYFFLD